MHINRNEGFCKFNNVKTGVVNNFKMHKRNWFNMNIMSALFKMQTLSTLTNSVVALSNHHICQSSNVHVNK